MYNSAYQPLEIPSTTELTPRDIDYMKDLDAKRFNELVQVTIALAQNVCWWEQPTVCRWERWEDSSEFMQLPPILQDFNLNYDAIMLAKSERLFKCIQKSVKAYAAYTIDNFDLLNKPDDVKLYYLITVYIMPRLSITYQFDCELKEEEEKLEIEMKRREHIRREYEEDQKMERERKEQLRLQNIQRKEERKAEKIAERERQLEENEDAELPVEEEESDTAEEELEEENMLDGEAVSAVEPVFQFKKIVLGTAARQLFPFIGTVPAIQVMQKMTRFSTLTFAEIDTTDRYLLTQLLTAIDQYNESEKPIIKTGPTKILGDINKTNIAKPVKGKKGKDKNKSIIEHRKPKEQTSGLIFYYFYG